MTTLETTSAIARASLRVLGRHRRLMWLPALSLASTLAVLIATLPFLSGLEGISGGVVLAGLYFAINLVNVFFAAALTCEGLRALREDTSSVPGGLCCAASRLGALASLAAIDTTVGVALGALSSDKRRSLAGHLLGAGWQLVTFLALPVLVAERRGGYDSMVRAGRLFRQTWGETALAELGVRVITANFVVLILGLLILLGQILDQPLAALVVVALALAFFVVVAALQAIYRAALYIYAAEGVIPDDFDTPEMDRVWKVK